MRWRGPFEASIDDVDEHALQIGPDIFSCNADRLDALLMRPSIAAEIGQSNCLEIVSQPIDFDGDGSSLAIEIEHEGAKWVLPPEL